jgi:SAM-dependent methyltransferase
LSLGRTPLANALLHEDQLAAPEPTFPLELVFCPACSLVQITETVPPAQLFRDYAYFSSFSDTMLTHAESLARRLMQSCKLQGDSLVVEAASNDGYLLQHYRQHGIPVLGIEPAENIARVAREKRDVPTLSEFFSRDLAERLARSGRRADVFHAHNVLAHVADLNGFVSGIERLLDSGGLAVIEVPYVKDLIDRVEFDTIYHEHLCYFSLTALDCLFRRHRLKIVDVERLDIHGGSLRIFASRSSGIAPRVASSAVSRLLAEEAAWGVDRFDFYQGFAAKVTTLRDNLLSLLEKLKSDKRRVAVYGASAKGSTLLNYFGLGRDSLEFVVDRSTVKQGRYTPGTHLKIYSPDKLLEARPDYVLLLTWNFADEILQQQAAYRKQGGKFIIPIPEVKVA